MPEVEPEEDQAPLDAPPDDPAPAPGRSAALPVAIGLAVVFAVTSVLLAFVAVSLQGDKDELGGDQEELIGAAAQFAQAFVDRDGSIESLRDDVVALSTEEFADQFVDGIDTVVQLDEAVGLVSTQATISDVFVTAANGPSAQAIVVYDSQSTFADGRTVRNENQYMILRLLDIDGTWLVDNTNDLLRVLSNALESSGTTAPPG